MLLEVLLGDAFGALLGDPLDDPLATSRVCFWATSWEQLMGCLWVSACGLSGMRVVDLLCPGELFGGAMGVPLGGWGAHLEQLLGDTFEGPRGGASARLLGRCSWRPLGDALRDVLGCLSGIFWGCV